jgi:hypothetical protein
VLEQLLDHLLKGGNAKKAGAVNASDWVHDDSREEELKAARTALQAAALEEFIANDDLDVRRCLIAALDLQTANASQERRTLVEQAIRIARVSDDDYIRHRVEVQLGAHGLLIPLHRE